MDKKTAEKEWNLVNSSIKGEKIKINYPHLEKTTEKYRDFKSICRSF